MVVEIVKVDFKDALIRYGDPKVRVTLEWGDDV
jgi:hypothetical protein